VASPVPAPSAPARDRALAAALAEADLEGRPVDLAVRRADRRRHQVNLVVVGVAAAAVAAVVAVAAVAIGRDDTGSSNVAGSSGETATTVGASAATTVAAATTIAGGGSTAGGATSTAGGATSTAISRSAETAAPGLAPTAAGAGVPYLGEADDDGALRTLVQQLKSSALSTDNAAPVPNACTIPSAQLLGTVTWQGTLAYVFVTDSTDATVVRADTCQTLTVVTLT
jgi:hypothetical protein